MTAILTLLGLSTLAPAGSTDESHPADRRLRKERRLRPGDVIRRRGVGLTVPDRGEAVWAEVLEPGRGAEVVGVETRSDGSVVEHSEAATAGAGSVSSLAAAACEDRAYAHNGIRWGRTFEWSFRRRSTPSNIRRRRATRLVRRAVTNITGARNDCGLGDRISASADYRGSTRAGPDITRSARCTRRDRRSVVGFGDLPWSYLAMTCWWIRDGRVVEADVKLNKVDYRWVARVGSGCRIRFSIEAVLTHEMGHVFGLRHVSESLHPALTMSPVIIVCQNSEATLGLGDIRGLEALY